MSKETIKTKEVIVNDIADKLSRAASCVVLNFNQLTVEEDTELRKLFREANVDYKVYKNTLVRRAAEKNGNMDKFNDTDLVGTNSFAISYEDAVLPAKIASDFAKKHPKLELKMGYVEGSFYDSEGITKIASIPSREALLAKLVGSLQAPISNLVYLLDAVAKKKSENEN